MKLYRFTASNTNRVISTVSETLGPDAMVYSTRKIPGGVEVLAGLPTSDQHMMDKKKLNEYEYHGADEIKIQEALSEAKMIEGLKLQIEGMNDTIRTLSDSVLLLQQVFLEKVKSKPFLRHWEIFKKIMLTKISFPHRRQHTSTVR